MDTMTNVKTTSDKTKTMVIIGVWSHGADDFRTFHTFYPPRIISL